MLIGNKLANLLIANQLYIIKNNVMQNMMGGNEKLNRMISMQWVCVVEETRDFSRASLIFKVVQQPLVE